MKNLFYMGGPLFMSILTILFVVMCAWIVYHFVLSFNPSKQSKDKSLLLLEYGKSIGLFALITGIFGQLIGLYSAFSAIEQAGSVSPAMVYSGLKVSMVTTFYGIFIYLTSLILWLITSFIVSKKN
jgi:hypothetical protein